MRYPVVGILSALTATLGLYWFVWYHDLSQAEREDADRLFNAHAIRLYQKTRDQLTGEQIITVLKLVYEHFGK